MNQPEFKVEAQAIDSKAASHTFGPPIDNLSVMLFAVDASNLRKINERCTQHLLCGHCC